MQSPKQDPILAADGWIDISLPIDTHSIPWSGLEGPSLRWEARIDAGDAVNVGRLELSLHTATHADAPKHVVADGADVAALDPSAYIGEALVVHVSGARTLDRATLMAAGIAAEANLPPRVLVATDQPFDGRSFPEQVIPLAPDAARWLLSLGLRLIGVDQPSVDPLDSKALESHHVLLDGGACILENLDLTRVSPGRYDLIALPLRIAGADASPVRAMVRRRQGMA